MTFAPVVCGSWFTCRVELYSVFMYVQYVRPGLMAFFKVRRNVIFERARFNRRCQREGEPIDTYIMELYKLTENCDYGALTAEMIRDRIVVGIRDETLSKRLQLDPDLTLE